MNHVERGRRTGTIWSGPASERPGMTLASREEIGDLAGSTSSERPIPDRIAPLDAARGGLLGGPARARFTGFSASQF